MGYILGTGKGKGKIITNATGQELDEARYIQVPSVKPQRGSNLAGLRKSASSISGDVTRTAPLFNDPRYTSSTLAIPTDERTLHGLYRFFVETDPIVGSTHRILTELPLASLRMGQCEDTGVQQHYEEMWERINGGKLIHDITSERYEIGTCVSFGAFNQSDYMWDQMSILNPDYVKIESTWVNQRPLVKLIPDEQLKKIVHTQSPKPLYDQLPHELIRYVLFNQEIPLDPNNTFIVTHAKRPYETKGKSIIKRILKVLMLEDRFNQANFALATRHAVPMMLVKLGAPDGSWLPDDTELDSVREMMCYDDQTEVLTDNGFKKHNEVLSTDKIGCFNPETSGLEFHAPIQYHEYNHDGEMIHFTSKCTDVKVTSNHRMWVKRDDSWKIVLANDVNCKTDKFRANVDNWIGEEITDEIEIAGKMVNTDAWFSFVGWYVAEGSTATGRRVTVTQKEGTEEQKILLSVFEKLPWKMGLVCGYNHNIYNAELTRYIEREIGVGSNNKCIPRWMLNATVARLEKLFEGYMLGDGTTRIVDSGYVRRSCATVSKKLADCLQEVAFKLGYACNIKISKDIYMRDADGTRHYIRRSGKLKGQPYFDKYNLVFSKHYLSTTPGLSCNNDKILLDISDRVLPFDVIPKRGDKQGWFDWDKIDLPDLLQRFGSAQAVGKQIGCSDVAVRVRMKKIGIQCGKPGQRVSNYNWKENKHFQREHYKGKVWCFTVPYGLMIVRRNGFITVQGNSAFELDPNFSLIYHSGIQIEHVGSNGKMLPVGPELDRVYRLKFIGMGVNEQLITGQGGSYAAAFVNMEVQRQRFLNLQLTLETLVHTGWFKPVADLCGFYRIKQAVASWKGTSSYKFGKDKQYLETEFMQQFSTLRDDFKDNREFREYVSKRTEEITTQSNKTMREYVYPKLDWGAHSAASDENLKNFVKWLTDKRPHLVDDAVLARLARLDRDDQEKAYIKDLERARDRDLELAKKGLLNYKRDLKKGPGGGGDMGGPIDLGGIGDIGVDMGPPPGGGMVGPEATGGEPDMPVGAGGAPDSAMGGVPSGMTQSRFRSLEREVTSDVTADDLVLSAENQAMIRNKSKEDIAILRAVRRIP